MKIYIAGPMTGLPDNNYKEFNGTAAWLRNLGHEALNPAENEAPENPTWENWMKLAIAQVIQADAVLMLPRWVYSRGAQIEHKLAKDLGIPVYYSLSHVPQARGAAVSI